MARSNRKLKYIVIVEELGPINTVKIAPNIAKQMKNAAKNKLISMVVLPKNSDWIPITINIIPKINGF